MEPEPRRWSKEMEPEPGRRWSKEMEPEPRRRWSKEMEPEPRRRWSKEMEPEPGRRWSKEMEPEPGRRWSKEMEPEPGRRWSKEMEPEPRRRWSKEMEPEPGRKRSRDLPPELSELMDKLIKEANSFIQQFDTKESTMRGIVRELRRICEEVEEVQRRADQNKSGGLVGFLSSPHTVVRSHVSKMWSERESGKKVEDLGKQFQWIVEPLKGILEEIKETCEKLEDKAAEYQSRNTLEKMEEFEELLRRVSRLKDQSFGVVYIVMSLIETIGNLVTLIVDFFRVTPTPEKDKKLRDSITKSADQSQMVTDEFETTKTLLEEILN